MKNDYANDIDIRINTAEKSFLALEKFFRTKTISRKT